MGYATLSTSNEKMERQINTGYIQHVGFDNTALSPNLQQLFDPKRIIQLQEKITQLLEGVSKDGRPIIVPVETIGSVLYQCYQSNSPLVGDIYTRYIIDQDYERNDVRTITDRAVNIIVSYIRDQYEMIENNKKLTVWNALLGDFNNQGLRAHAPIKIRKGGPDRFQFNMRY